MPAIPKKSATVILLRDTGSGGLEVFLLKRHEKSSFMAGNFVYPGGRIDPADCSPQIEALCRGISPEEASQILGLASPGEASGYWVGGIRELFEEAGILFAYNRDGRLFHPEDSNQKERISRYRASLQKGERTLPEILQPEELLLALDQLHYYAHWITPEARPERFDTRFFVARHPEGQEAEPDQKETTTGIWIAPQKALQENSAKNVILSPPTLKTLEDLSRFASIDQLLKALDQLDKEPILPVLTKVSGQPLLVFPWDPEYDIFEQGEIPLPLEHGHPSGPDDNTTRLLLKEGGWHPYCR
jgi:8-oxo-dGTP pyrophosphatase MutT (NUDIX family)